jgi:predicted SAM-dependent methyltransferase
MVGWVNLEINTEFKADIYCNVMDFYPRKSLEDFEGFDEVMARDILAHLTYKECKLLLRRIYQWLNNNGLIYVHLPDFKFCAMRALEGDHEAKTWLYGTDGERAMYETNHMKWCYTRQEMKEILEKIGYTIIDEKTTCEGFGFLLMASKRG